MSITNKIRRLHFVEGHKVSQIAKQFGISRTTIYKYLNSKDEPKYNRSEPVSSPKLDPYKAQLTTWLEQDAKRPKRERRNAVTLYQQIQLEGYRGAYDGIQRFVKDWKSQSKSLSKQAYVPLQFAPGESCQFDWSHEQVMLAGCHVKIKVAHFRLCHSRKSYLRAYPRETQEMVFDAHIRAFEFFNGVPRKMIYDNPKTIVTTIYAGKQREFNRRFLSLMNHYLIEPVPCTPGSGWEKGQVERQVGVMRQRLFVPRVKFADMDELNQWLEQQCHRLGERPHPTCQDQTIDDLFAQEKSALRPVMSAFDGYYERTVKVRSTAMVSYDRNQYSVPCEYVGKAVSLRAYATQIIIVTDEQVIAKHPRSFGRGQMQFDPWHYLSILQYKPGALRNGAPFVDWQLPKALQTIRSLYLKRQGGDKDFVQLLLLAREHSIEPVTVACELALESGTTQLPVITNFLHRLLEPSKPTSINVVDTPVLTRLPKANTHRYDNLVTGGDHV